MASRRLWLALGIWTCLVSCNKVPRFAGACSGLSGADRGTLITYVREKYHVPPAVPIEVSDLGFVDRTCYRKLDFRASQGHGPLRITLYASPDLRFLSHDLMDAQLDPTRQELTGARDFTSALAGGNPASIGSKDASVTIVLFSDFQCPYCARMANGLMKDAVGPDKEKVRILFLNFPLPMHAWARKPAEAAACARQQGEGYFWSFHNYFFQHQEELTPETFQHNLFAYASSLPAFQVSKLKTCIDKGAASAEVDNDIALGKDAGVSGTPTLFVAGERLVGYDPGRIRAVIEQATGGKTEAAGAACPRSGQGGAAQGTAIVPAAMLARGNPAATGRRNAPVTLTLFSDFQCPYCARMADGLRREILPSEGAKVRILFRNFPLPMHTRARSAAEAAACARQQGDRYFWSLHDHFLQRQRELKRESLRSDVLAFAAGLRGIQIPKLKACIDQRATAAEVEEDIALGKQIGVTGTPTLFVEGKRVVGYQAEQIRRMIERVAGTVAQGKRSLDSALLHATHPPAQ